MQDALSYGLPKEEDHPKCSCPFCPGTASLEDLFPDADDNNCPQCGDYWCTCGFDDSGFYDAFDYPVNLIPQGAHSILSDTYLNSKSLKEVVTDAVADILAAGAAKSYPAPMILVSTFEIVDYYLGNFPSMRNNALYTGGNWPSCYEVMRRYGYVAMPGSIAQTRAPI